MGFGYNGVVRLNLPMVDFSFVAHFAVGQGMEHRMIEIIFARCDGPFPGPIFEVTLADWW